MTTNYMLKKFLTTVLLSLLLSSILHAQITEQADPNPLRFADEIAQFTDWDLKNSFPKQAVLFAGSSSIRLWKTHSAFPEYPLINRGFGGAHISDMIHFYEEAIHKYTPRIIVFYCGDNDIAAGKPTQQVFDDYIEFTDRIKYNMPGIRLIYIPAKPSIQRWGKWPDMKDLNERIKVYNDQDPQLYYADTAAPMLKNGGIPGSELFSDDGLHLNDRGYALWESVLAPILQYLYKE